MKIHCDVCDKEEVSVFCSADEAALCDSCDRRVHHANKLAGKHLRFSLIHPSPKDFPRCDICRERRAFLFCQEDRAILCGECDIPIHKSNEHTQKHNRYFLTGIKLLSASAYSSYQITSSSSNGSWSPNAAAAAIDSESEVKGMSNNNLVSEKDLDPKSSSLNCQIKMNHNNYNRSCRCCCCCCSSYTISQEEGSSSVVSTSSISEYLMETLPGWHVEDFLDQSPTSPHYFCKTSDQILTDNDLDVTLGSFLSEDFSGRVPQSSGFPTSGPQGSDGNPVVVIKETNSKKISTNTTVHRLRRKCSETNGSAVIPRKVRCPPPMKSRQVISAGEIT